MATLSTPEAELGGAAPGIKYGFDINDMAKQLDGDNEHNDGFILEGDNTATVITITKQDTSWRSRHYALRAGWARGQVNEQHLDVSHTPGTELPADGLTKIMQASALAKVRQQLSLCVD